MSHVHVYASTVILSAALLIQRPQVADVNMQPVTNTRPDTTAIAPDDSLFLNPVKTNSHEIDWSPLIDFLQKTVVYLLLGWSVTRILMIFRKIIAIITCVQLISTALMIRMGIIEFALDENTISVLYEGMKSGIIEFGLWEFSSLLIGVWIGIVQTIRRPSVVIQSDFSRMRN